MQPENVTPAGDLREYLSVMRRRRLSIALMTGLTLASALFFSSRQTPVYRSETKVLVRSITTVSTQVPPVLNMENERARAASFPVAQLLREELGETRAPDALLEGLEVSVEPTSEVLAIRYTDPDPARAQRLSAGFADAYLQFRRDTAQTELESQLEVLEGQAAGLRREIAELDERIANADPGRQTQLTIQRDELQARQITLIQSAQSLRSEIRTLGRSGEVIQPADLPESPASPNHLRNGLLALVVGLALGVGLAFVRERLDDRLIGREDLERQTGSPVLAVIPRVGGWRKREETRLPTLTDPKSPTAEAYRTLRTNLEYLASTDGFKLLAVASPSLGEGKTTTAANLAVSLAKTGKRVIVVDADLRKPRLHAFFRLRSDVGVTTVLAGHTSLSDAAQRCGVETLRVLASGPVPPNPAELLGTPQMDRLLDEMGGFADYVILDTAPVLAVADTLVLAPRTDGVIVVADAERTHRGSVNAVREHLQQVGARIVGSVYNNFDPSKAKNAPPYYRSYYSYRPEDQRSVGNGDARTVTAGDPEEMWS